MLRLDRKALAAVVLVCWVIGLAALARRRHNVSDVALLAQGALRIDPATYYYSLSRNGETIGDATSRIDTGATGFKSRNVVRLHSWLERRMQPQLPSGSQVGDTDWDDRDVVATSVAYLARGFTLDSFSVVVTGIPAPLRLHGIPAKNSRVLLPSIAPIAFILRRPPRVGASVDQWLYNPVARRLERVTISIAAESLLSVVDSATFDSTMHRWIAAHSDTVRSWKVTTPSRSISAWVDSHGRIVTADAAGGANLTRTAYEIAMLNPKLQPRLQPELQPEPNPKLHTQ